MGAVAEYLHALIARQVNEHRLVVWFDPERHYAELARTFSVPDTAVARYEGSFFALRHEIEPLLNDTVAPRLVVYVPLSEEETSNALMGLLRGQGGPARERRDATPPRRCCKSRVDPARRHSSTP